MDIYQQMVPPPPIDTIRDGLPNLRHGTIEMHPLEVQLKKAANEQVNTDFQRTAALFGIGFAKELKFIRKNVDKSNVASEKLNLHQELVNGQLDDIDFDDIFEASQSHYDLRYDPHVEIEKRVFGKPLRLDI